MPAFDALFDRPGSLGVGIQQGWAVVGLDYENIGFANVLADMSGHMPKIGDPREALAWGEEVSVSMTDVKAHGVLSVMRDGEGADFEVTKVEGGAGFEEFPSDRVLEGALKCARGGLVREDLDVRVAGKPFETGAVITVLMGEKDRVDAIEGFPRGGEHFIELAR